MTEVLLKELSNSDIDWLTTVGHQAEMAAGTVLVERGKSAEALHMVIDGALSVSIPHNDNLIGWELTQLGSGELVGETTFVGQRLPVVTVKTLEKSLILSIPRSQMVAKLEQDVRFAAHFYRAVAILLSNQLRAIDTRLGSAKLFNPEEPLKKGLFVLGELKDSDIDWMMSVGSKERIAAGQVIIQQGRPIDALYILLEGTTTVSICHAQISRLFRVFAAKDSGSTTKQELNRLTSGEIMGEMSFLENEQAYVTVKSLEECLVLSLPRDQLAVKLQMDVRFAARFYRAIAAVVEGRLRSKIVRLTYGDRAYGISQMLDEEVETEDEIDIDALDNTALAGARFDWILSQLR